MNVMSYRGYRARIEYESDDEILVGHLAGVSDIVGFHADTVAELKAAFHEAVDGYVDACAKIGKKPEKPYSGQLMVRVTPEVHADAARAAELGGVSLSKFAEAALREAVDRRMG